MITDVPESPAERTRGQEGCIMKSFRSKPLPLEAQYLYQQGLFLSSEGKKEEALKSFRMAVILAPCFCDAINAMGNCLDELGRYEEAIVKYNKVLEIDPRHTEALFKREIVRYKLMYGSGGGADERWGRSTGTGGRADQHVREPDEKEFFRCLLFQE
jgi:tetratricopeptide (TPR) repeat protein